VSLRHLRQTINGFDGNFSGDFHCPLPRRSLLILQGNGADISKHCVPSVVAERVSVTLRRMRPHFKEEIDKFGSAPQLRAPLLSPNDHKVRCQVEVEIEVEVEVEIESPVTINGKLTTWFHLSTITLLMFPFFARRNHQKAQEEGRSFISKATFVQQDTRPTPPQQPQPPPPPAAPTPAASTIPSAAAPSAVDNNMPQSVEEVCTVLCTHACAWPKFHMSRVSVRLFALHQMDCSR